METVHSRIVEKSFRVGMEQQLNSVVPHQVFQDGDRQLTPESLRGGEYMTRKEMLIQRVESEDRHASTR